MLNTDIQLLEPGSVVRLFEIDGTAFGADVMRFHAHNTPHTPEEIEAAQLSGDPLPAKVIWWQGLQYYPWPAQVEGLESNSDGAPASPTLTVGNVDNSITALCLAFEDMLQAKVTIRETMAKYLDAANFPDGNPDADPEQEAVEIWFIDRKSFEDDETVQFELASPADLSGQMIGRQMTAYCYWCQRGNYRGPDCGYTGEAMFTEDDEPTDNPELDQCSGTVTGCTLRFGENNELPHGGFIAVRLIR